MLWISYWGVSVDDTTPTPSVLTECTQEYLTLGFSNTSLTYRYPVNAKLDTFLEIPAKSFQIPSQYIGFKFKKDKKFFYENKENPHLDARYGKVTNSQIEKLSALKLLFKNWAEFADYHKLPYWISHGALIGWYWTKKLLPWDSDFDIQVPASLFPHLETLQADLYKYRYKLEINPNYLQRTHQKANVIDARFIDTFTGYYIDITGLSIVGDLNLRDPILKCKSVHSYRYSNIFPLVRTIFEDVLTWRPNQVSKTLQAEYTESAYTKQQFRNYQLSHFMNEWLDINECSTMLRLFILPSLRNNNEFPKYRWKEEFINMKSEKPECLMLKIGKDGRITRIKGYWELNF